MSERRAPETTPQFRIELEISGRTEVGPTRSENQDAIMVATVVGTRSGTRLSWSGHLPAEGVPVAVIDGMGGYAGGSDAAALTATALATVALEKEAPEWDTWFEALSSRIAQAGQVWGTPDMGATAALLGITPSGMVIVNVGDCRIYRVIGGYLGQLSVDDRTDDPDSSAVTQALGGSTRIDAHTWLQAYQGETERYVLCTDGVWGTLDPAVLRDLCTADRSPSEIVDAVVASIYAQSGSDNGSIVLVEVTATPTEVGSPELDGDPAWSVDVDATPRERSRG